MAIITFVIGVAVGVIFRPQLIWLKDAVKKQLREVDQEKPQQ